MGRKTSQVQTSDIYIINTFMNWRTTLKFIEGSRQQPYLVAIFWAHTLCFLVDNAYVFLRMHVKKRWMSRNVGGRLALKQQNSEDSAWPQQIKVEQVPKENSQNKNTTLVHL